MIRLLFCHSTSTVSSKKYHFIKVSIEDYTRQMVTWRSIACYIPVIILDDSAVKITNIDAELDNMNVVTLKYKY